MRGSNCLLLAAYEGSQRCEVEDAEKAAFGESNTFRFVAATGELADLQQYATRRLAVRIEASYQMSANGSGPGLLSEDYDELVAEAPFLVATLPIGQQQQG